jgi:hypothetical protein
VASVGFKFTLVLSREITDEESVILLEANSAVPNFGPDTLPTNASIAVTKMDFDDTISASLEEAIESALGSVKKVPELSVPGLTVPAQPAQREEADEPTAAAGEELEAVTAKKPAPKKLAAKKPAAKKPSEDEEPVEATAGSV